MNLPDIERQRRGDHFLAGGVGVAALALIGLGLAYSPDRSNTENRAEAATQTSQAELFGDPIPEHMDGETWSSVQPSDGQSGDGQSGAGESGDGEANDGQPADTDAGSIVADGRGAIVPAVQPSGMPGTPGVTGPGETSGVVAPTPGVGPQTPATPAGLTPDGVAAPQPGLRGPTSGITAPEPAVTAPDPGAIAPESSTPNSAAPTRTDTTPSGPAPRVPEPITAPLPPAPPLENPTGPAPGPGDPVAAPDNRPRVGDHPAKQFGVLTRLLAPRSITKGKGFRATVQVHNTGDVRLRGLRVSLAGRNGIEDADPKPMRFDLDPIAPGATIRIERTFRAASVGQGRVVLSIRDPNGWAGAGSLAVVDIVPVGAPQRGPSGKAKGVALAMSVQGKAPQRIQRRQPFRMDTVLRNDGEVVLRDVQIVLALGPGMRTVDPDADASLKLRELAPGASKTISVVLVADQSGLRQIRASARDAQGWAAAGIVQLVSVTD